MSEDVKRLYRSRSQRMIAGVSGGLGDYLNIDATVIRLIFVIAALWGGAGIIVYLVMWLMVPEEPAGTEVPAPPEEKAEEPESEE
jgi:phage shock protein C